ncbi:hypothetical protein QQF64_023965 [Cirrhinus molitorella]|uniref:Uncharacterized protein n=1 Tax=Cirrhinus molitorella TaxID=172907 RepID=A0ABR3NJU6_9TELE
MKMLGTFVMPSALGVIFENSPQKVAPERTNSDHVPVPGTDLTSDVRNVATAGHKICVRITKQCMLCPWSVPTYISHHDYN